MLLLTPAGITHKEQYNMEYALIWKGEEIDSFDTLLEARKMKTEYNIAFKGGVTIKRRRR